MDISESWREGTMAEKQVGETASAGWQIGVRRTLPVTQEQAWELLMAPMGLALWLGRVEKLDLQVGERFTTAEGTTGELRVVKPLNQVRLTWQRPGWERASTLQIRCIPVGPEKTTISFHQEWLADGTVRAEMKARWEGALATLVAGAANGNTTT